MSHVCRPGGGERGEGWRKGGGEKGEGWRKGGGGKGGRGVLWATCHKTFTLVPFITVTPPPCFSIDEC